MADGDSLVPSGGPDQPVPQAHAGDSGVSGGSGVRPGRGHLRIYLGSAAGVGKTYAMLGEGHRRAARGADVVVAFAESGHVADILEKPLDPPSNWAVTGLYFYDARVSDNRGPIIINSLPNDLGHVRLGLSVSRRVVTAHFSSAGPVFTCTHWSTASLYRAGGRRWPRSSSRPRARPNCTAASPNWTRRRRLAPGRSTAGAF